MILFDDSGSMKQNDPSRLAGAAAELFVELSPASDLLGLVAFSEVARVAVPSTEVSRARPLVRRALAGMTQRGATTDIGAALAAALELLGPEQPGVADRVLLLTDGEVDLGAARATEVPGEIQRLKQDVAASFRQRGVPIHAVAFSSGADRALLEHLAGATGGQLRVVSDAATLHRAFSELFMSAAGAEALPVRNGAFMVDESIGEASVVLSRGRDGKKGALITPGRERLEAGAAAREDVAWKSTEAYDLVKLAQPEAGPWQVEKAEDASDPLALINASSVELRVQIGPLQPTVDDRVQIEVELLEEGQRVTSFARTKGLAVSAHVTQPSGKVRVVPLDELDPGRFGASFTNSATGFHAVQVTAVGPAMERERRDGFVVLPPCFGHTLEVTPGPLLLVTMSPDCPAYEGLRVEVQRSVNGTPEPWAPMELREEGGYRAAFPSPEPGEKVALVWRARATCAGAAIEIRRGPLELPEAPPDAWHRVVLARLAAINLPLVALLGAAALAARLVRRLRSRRARDLAVDRGAAH